MLFIENTGFSINGDSASSQLGKETGYWIFPLKGDKPFKIATEALLPRLSLTLEKLGIKVSEDVLTKALRTHSTKELQLAEAMSGKAVSKELPIVIEKTAPIRTPNIVQNKQAKDAIKEIERKLQRKLTPKQIGEFHRHVSKQNYSYHELVDEGYWLFREP